MKQVIAFRLGLALAFLFTFQTSFGAGDIYFGPGGGNTGKVAPAPQKNSQLKIEPFAPGEKPNVSPGSKVVKALSPETIVPKEGRFRHLSPGIAARLQNLARPPVAKRAHRASQIDPTKAIDDSPRISKGAKGSEDFYEPNNNINDAYDISSYYDVDGYAWDDDWYYIELPLNATDLYLDLDFVHYYGDLDLKLFNSNGTQVASSASSSDGESIDYDIPSSSDRVFYVRVFPYASDDQGNDYTLAWDYAASGPIDDDFEPNDSRSTAADVTPWLETELDQLYQCNDDWYKIRVPDDAVHLNADISFLHSQGDIELALYNSSGTQLDSSVSSSNTEAVDHDVTAGATYYLKVYGVGTADCNEYILYWDYIAGPTDDLYEENDTRSSAYDITSRRNTDIRAKKLDEDWYKFNLPSDSRGTLRVELNFTHSQGDIDLQVTNSSGTVIGQSAGAGDDEVVNLNITSGGTFYIRAYYQNRGNEYDVYWNFTADTTPVEDDYEPNDTRSTAYDLRSHEQDWLSTIDGLGYQRDEDWYRIDVTEGYRRVLVEVDFTHSAGDIDIGLYDGAGNRLDYSQGTGNSESIDHIVPTPGVYYIKVYGANRGNSYDLWWDDTQDGVNPNDDSYESNDTRATAYDLSGGEGTWNNGIAWDDDWFRIYVTEGYQRVHVDVQFDDSVGDLDVQLVNSSGTTVASSLSTDDNEAIDTVVASSGYYYIRIFPYGENDAGNNYQVRWWTEAGTPPPPSNPSCFIATAANGSPYEKDVRFLRAFRDEHLLTNAVGRLFVEAYYTISPPIARFIEKNEEAKKWVRVMLEPLIEWVKPRVSEGAYEKTAAPPTAKKSTE